MADTNTVSESNGNETNYIPGNIDLYKQPKVNNPITGETSTVFSKSFGLNGKEVLLSSVTPEGVFLKTNKEVLDYYKKTGKHLGIFNTPQEADQYAEKLHQDYASGKYNKTQTSETPEDPKPAIDWKNYYSGVDSLQWRLPETKANALKQLDQAPNPKEARARLINQKYVTDTVKNLDPDIVRNNWQGIKNAYAQGTLGLKVKDISDEDLYNEIGKKIGVTPEQIQRNSIPPWEQYGEIKAATNYQVLSAKFNANTKNLQDFIQGLNKPFFAIPRAPEFKTDEPGFIKMTPQFMAAAWNGVVAPLIEGIETPMALGTLEGSSVLKEAQVLADTLQAGTKVESKLATDFIKSIHGYYVGSMLKTGAEGLPKAYKEATDTNLTPQQRIEGAVQPVTSLILGTAAAAHAVASHSAEGAAIINDSSGKSVQETIQNLNDKAESTNDNALESKINDLVDNLEKSNAEALLPPPKAVEEQPVASAETPTPLGIGQDIPLSEPVAESEKRTIDIAREKAGNVISDLNASSLMEEAETKIGSMEDVEKRAAKYEQQMAEPEKYGPPIEKYKLALEERQRFENLKAAVDATKAKAAARYERALKSVMAENSLLPSGVAPEDMGDVVGGNITDQVAAEDYALFLKEEQKRIDAMPMTKLREEMQSKLDVQKRKLEFKHGIVISGLKEKALEQKQQLTSRYKQKLGETREAYTEVISELKEKAREQKQKLRENLTSRYEQKLDETREAYTQRIQNMRESFAKTLDEKKGVISDFKHFDANGRLDYDQIRQSLLDVAAGLSKEKQAKYLSAITEALRRPALGKDPEGQYRRVTNVTFRMLRDIAEEEKMGIAQNINKNIAKALEGKNVDVQFKEKIRNLMRYILRNQPVTDDPNAIQPIKDNASNVQDIMGPGDDQIQNITAISNVKAKEMPVEALRALDAKVQDLLQQGKEKVASRQEAYDRTVKRLEEAILNGDSNKWEQTPLKRKDPIKGSSFAENMVNAGIKAINYTERTNRPLLTKDVVLNNMEGNEANYNGQLSKYINGTIDLDYNIRENLKDRIKAPLKALTKKYKFNEESLKRIGAYAIAQEDNGVERLKQTGIQDPLSIKLSPEEMEYYNTARQTLDNTFKSVQKLARDLYNIDIPPVRKYFPFHRDWTLYEKDIETPKMAFTKGEEFGLEQLCLLPTLEQDYAPRNTTQTSKGFIIERKENAEGALRLNASEILDQHFDKVAHMLAYQRDLKMLGQVVRKDSFAEKYGKDGQKYVLDFLDTIARDSDPANAVKVKWLDALKKRTTVGVMFLRISSHIKHVGNMPFALYYVKPGHLVSSIYDSFTNSGSKFISDNFREVTQRSGGETEIAELGTKSFWDKVAKNGFILETALDQVTARSAVLGAYKQELARKGLDYKNFDKIPVDKEAQAYAMRIARGIVTSPLRKDLPQVLSRGFQGKQTSYARAVFQYQTTMLRQWSFINQEIYQKGVKDLDWRTGALATMVVMASIAAETTASRGVKKMMGSENQSNKSKKEGDSWLGDFTNELIRRVPYAGNLTAALHFGETGIPSVDSITGGLRSLGSSKSPEKFWETSAQTYIPAAVAGLGYPEAAKVIPMASPLLRKKRNIDTRYYESK